MNPYPTSDPPDAVTVNGRVTRNFLTSADKELWRLAEIKGRTQALEELRNHVVEMIRHERRKAIPTGPTHAVMTLTDYEQGKVDAYQLVLALMGGDLV
jgi:hypothetical protein